MIAELDYDKATLNVADNPEPLSGPLKPLRQIKKLDTAACLFSALVFAGTG